MSDIHLSSEKIDRKFFQVSALAAFFLFAAGFGCFSVSSVRGEWWQSFSLWRFAVLNWASSINAGISVGLALLTWSVFRLFRPLHPNRNWRIAEVILVPLCWLVLLLAVDALVAWLSQRSLQELQDIQPTLQN